jgi:hypothetical protein
MKICQFEYTKTCRRRPKNIPCRHAEPHECDGRKACKWGKPVRMGLGCGKGIPQPAWCVEIPENPELDYRQIDQREMMLRCEMILKYDIKADIRHCVICKYHTIGKKEEGSCDLCGLKADDEIKMFYDDMRIPVECPSFFKLLKVINENRNTCT